MHKTELIISKSVLHIFLIASFLVIIIGLEPAFAMQDSGPWNSGNSNYAATKVRVICGATGTGTTADANDDGICSNWKTPTGLQIDFLDNSQLNGNTVEYKYNWPCNPGATYNPSDNHVSNPDLSTPGTFFDPGGELVCPSNSARDVYVELDWMNGHDITITAINDTVQAYNRMGIHLHIQLGEQPLGAGATGNMGVHYCVLRSVNLNGGTPQTNAGSCASGYPTTSYQSYPWLKQSFFGTKNERPGTSFDGTTACPSDQIPSAIAITDENTKKSYNCLTAKRQVFHYGLVGMWQYGAWSSSGWSEIPGNDFEITLGSFTNQMGNNDEQEASLMHELGHNFGLNHGGVGDTNNCKPNYLSVMNYLYQFRTNDVCRPLEYSNNALSPLPEAANSLSDSNIGNYAYSTTNPTSGPDGQGGGTCPNDGSTQRKIFWAPTSPAGATTGVTDDWGNNGNSGTEPYSTAKILNNFGGACTYSTPVTLTGFNDVAFLQAGGNSQYPHSFNFRPNSNFWQGTPSFDNVTSDELGTGDNHIDGGPVIITSVIPQALASSSCPEGQTCQPPQPPPTPLPPSTQTCNSNCCGCETMSLGLIIGLLIAILIIVIIILLLRKRP